MKKQATSHADDNDIEKNDNQLLENQLCHRMYVISNAITRAYRPLLEKTNLTYPQYVAMMALWEKDNITIGELHTKTKIDMGCLSVMLKKMCHKDLLQLIPSDIDKRVKYVQLTEHGKAIKAVANLERNNLADTSLLEADEFQTLIHLLDKLKDNLPTT